MNFDKNYIEPENVGKENNENVQWSDDNESPRRHGKSNNVLLYMNNLSDRSWNRRGNDASVQNFDDSEVGDFQQQMETSKKVLELETKLGLSITQVNGQRKLGPPPELIGKPSPGPECEVFVGKIPRDLYEDEIYPIFRRAGDIYEIRLMMHFSGLNRGYCFVMYMNLESARKAIKTLNNYEIRPGRKVGVVASVNNCRLSINQLPPNLDSQAFVKKIYAATGEVSSISVFRFPNGQVKSVIISYKTHIGAAMGRRRLVPERSSFLQGAVLSIDWAHPDKMPYNVIEEIWGLDEHGNVEMTKQQLIAPKKSSKTSKEEFLEGNDENFGNFMPSEQNTAAKLRNFRQPSASMAVGNGFRGEVAQIMQNFPKKSSRVLRDLNTNRKTMRTIGNSSKESAKNLGRPHTIIKHSFEKRNKENYPGKNRNFSTFPGNYPNPSTNPSGDLIKNFNQLNLQPETFVRKPQTQNYVSPGYNPPQIVQNPSALAGNWPVYHEKIPTNGNMLVYCVQMDSEGNNNLPAGNFLVQNYTENRSGQVFPSFHDNQGNLCANNAVLRLAPKFDTRAFGLGKFNQDQSQVFIQNYEAMMKTPRPILRNHQ